MLCCEVVPCVATHCVPPPLLQYFNNKPNAFEISTAAKSLFVCADSPAHREEWISCIRVGVGAGSAASLAASSTTPRCCDSRTASMPASLTKRKRQLPLPPPPSQTRSKHQRRVLRSAEATRMRRSQSQPLWRPGHISARLRWWRRCLERQQSWQRLSALFSN